MTSLLCPTCGGSLSARWPYLEPESYTALDHEITAWKLGSDAGCALCEVVILAADHVLSSGRYSLGTKFDYTFGPVKDCHFYLEGRGNKSLRVRWGRKHKRCVIILEFVAKVLDVSTGPEIITIYPEEQDSAFQPFQPVFENRSSPQALSCTQQWLSICEHDHPKCQTPVDRSVPERLLEIEEDQLKLRIRPNSSARYVALSHCWGGVQPVRLLGHSLPRYQAGIPLQELPRNFQEAVQVARELGFKYLWIDSLCIIQDTPEDWEKQSSLMISTYGNADLVLGASAAVSASDGFLHSSSEAFFEEHRLQLKSNGLHDRHIRLRLTSLPLTDGPLDSRAWAYQERLVARRYLSFGSRELSWYCRETEFVETDWNYSSGREKNRTLLRNLEVSLESITGEDAVMDYWCKEIVPRYTSRSLTRQSDILVALSAIAEAFHAKYNWSYLAGIWKEDLLRSLAWRCSVLSNPRDVCCPSWSWASIDTGHMTAIDNPAHGHHICEELATIVEARTSPASVNRFGSVLDGLVRLRCPYIFGTLRIHGAHIGAWNLEKLEFSEMATAPNIRCYLDTPIARTSTRMVTGGQQESVRRVTYGEESDKTIGCQEGGQVTVYVLPLFTIADSAPGNLGPVMALMVGCIGLEPERYQRLGVCNFGFEGDYQEAQLQGMLRSMEHRSFTIV